jgi:dienelactone hydrolase
MTMNTVAEKTEMHVTERRFDLVVGDEVVPGIHWLPEAASGPHPTVIIGHGGTQHKRAPNVLGLARKLVRQLGCGVVALDAPGHGGRMTDEQRHAQAELLSRRQDLRLAPLSEKRMRTMMVAAPQAIAEWKALLDDLGTNPEWADGPFGFWGVSMGTAFGMPFLAGEPRIAAAVLGLGSLREPPDRQRAIAADITIPILFLFQWDDELMDRQAGLALWDAIASKEKTMHINPGPHVGIPLFERDDVVSFYRRHFVP